ncbi:MAG: cell division protein FtsB [Xanthomonadales bacterium]|nr:cell division protein FtsB [Xanthomonadales bacterium]
MRALLALLLLVLLALQYRMWFGEGGYRDVQRLAQRVEEQARENELLAQRNRELQAEVEDLRQGLEAIEERARSELGMIREDEEFYQVVPAPDQQAPANPSSDRQP